MENGTAFVGMERVRRRPFIHAELTVADRCAALNLWRVGNVGAMAFVRDAAVKAGDAREHWRNRSISRSAHHKHESAYRHGEKRCAAQPAYESVRHCVPALSGV